MIIKELDVFLIRWEAFKGIGLTIQLSKHFDPLRLRVFILLNCPLAQKAARGSLDVWYSASVPVSAIT
jgi:hypothetical protein